MNLLEQMEFKSRVAELEAERDRLRAEVKELREKPQTVYSGLGSGNLARIVQAAQDEAKEELERMRAELETERMRLVACGVVAMADTKETAASARNMAPQFRSAECDDVARRVDECIRLREKNEALLAANRDAKVHFDTLKEDFDRLRAGLLACARQAEALKRECSPDPESQQAIRNAQYQAISTAAHIVLGTVCGPDPILGDSELNDLRAENEALRKQVAELSEPVYEFEFLVSRLSGEKMFATASAWLYPGDALGVRRVIAKERQP